MANGRKLEKLSLSNKFYSAPAAASTGWHILRHFIQLWPEVTVPSSEIRPDLLPTLHLNG